MKHILFVSLMSTLLLGGSAFCQLPAQAIVDRSYIDRILNTLASDEMKGRHALTEDADRAADFIAKEFQEIGLTPYAENNYRQTFYMQQVRKKNSSIIWEGHVLEENSFLILGDEAQTHWNSSSNIPVHTITKKDDFASSFRMFAQSSENAIILVDPSFSSFIARFNKIYNRENIVSTTGTSATKVFVVADKITKDFEIINNNNIKPISLSNVAGVIPGKSKPNEYVIFSAHYDHIGIIKSEGTDSIANGADDDASGTTAMISLAKYYKNLNNNERTLIFVAFTAEEIGMFGSKYFSNNINADSVVAMINIEMIGKDAKFGPNSLYITGYDRSNLGSLMQQNLAGSSFKFYPDPYPQQNLFYRSDNAVLAALGVPAHTFSTSQIDKDKFYHTVKDDVTTLDIDNIKASIEAIAIGATGIINGSQTPSRVEKLKD
ncbi:MULTISPECIES: M20/M25/M40 family metallo-hydrolase [Sphingobacterium]|uniref:M20/M25/M40 family metallo-hydrolase n=1 Tax=Sphingobacterium TaxID=28453 RepID=UPI0013D9AEB2|nr:MULTISPECIES: M20/M25/M40 family metallo-hydrolase [unclassified Sphingobacterium]